MRKHQYTNAILAAFVAACLILPVSGFAGQMLDVNTATVEQLVEIKGLGEKTAEAIVQYREDHGPFASIDDLAQVKGIGEKKVESLREHLTAGESKP